MPRDLNGGAGPRELHRIVIHLLHLACFTGEGAAGATGDGMRRSRYGNVLPSEDEVVGVEFPPIAEMVVPWHSLAQMEGVNQAGGVDVPLSDKPGNDHVAVGGCAEHGLVSGNTVGLLGLVVLNGQPEVGRPHFRHRVVESARLLHQGRRRRLGGGRSCPRCGCWGDGCCCRRRCSSSRWGLSCRYCRSSCGSGRCRGSRRRRIGGRGRLGCLFSARDDQG